MPFSSSFLTYSCVTISYILIVFLDRPSGWVFVVITIAIIMGLKSVALGDGMVYMAPGEYKKGDNCASMSCFWLVFFYSSLCKSET